MTATRITRESVESLIQSDGELRVTRESVETLIQTDAELLTTRVSVETLILDARPDLTGIWGIPAGIP